MNYKIHKVHSLLHDNEEEWNTTITGFSSMEEAKEYLINENFKWYIGDIYCLNGYGICTTAIIKEAGQLSKKEIIDTIMDKASAVLGADPAYFGEDGAKEVEKQLNKLGHTLEELRNMED